MGYVCFDQAYSGSSEFQLCSEPVGFDIFAQRSEVKTSRRMDFNLAPRARLRYSTVVQSSLRHDTPRLRSS